MKKKMSVMRIEELAKIHGPFVRFSPEGNEADGDAVDAVIKDGETAELEGNAEFDKTRQALDMEKANAAKARTENASLNTQLSTVNSQVQELQDKLAAAEAKAEAAGLDVNLDPADYTDTDLAIVKKIQSMEKKLEAKEVQISSLQKTADGFKQSKVDAAAQAERDARYNEILNDLDAEYGAEYRNVAVKDFEAKAAAGEIKGGPAKATRALEKCYKQAVKAAKPVEKDKDVTLDSGQGGGEGVKFRTPGMENVKSGSVEEVLAQLSSKKNST